MSLASELAEEFAKREYTWSIKDSDERYTPDEDDLEVLLDNLAAALYSGAPGDSAEQGRLLVVKKHHGHDVYLHVGEYL